MPPDNTDSIEPGSDVSFPRDGVNSNTDEAFRDVGSGGITRLTDSSFNLAEKGTYLVMFQVNIDESGQLVLTLNGRELEYTVVGRGTGTSAIIEITLLSTDCKNSVLTVRNPEDNATSLHLTPLAGGTQAISARLVIIRLS